LIAALFLISSSALPLINFSSEGSEENLLILKIENMKRLKKLLGDRPVFFGSSRKRFLKNILENSAALTAELIRDSHSEGSTSSSEEKKGKEERRSPTVEELDWATAGTTAAAVTGMLSYAVNTCMRHPIRMFLIQERSG
jgi:dihydropteroate synthase